MSVKEREKSYEDPSMDAAGDGRAREGGNEEKIIVDVKISSNQAAEVLGILGRNLDIRGRGLE